MKYRSPPLSPSFVNDLGHKYHCLNPSLIELRRYMKLFSPADNCAGSWCTLYSIDDPLKMLSVNNGTVDRVAH